MLFVLSITCSGVDILRIDADNFIYAGQTAGVVLGVATTGVVVSAVGWEWTFYGTGILTLAVAVLWLAIVRDSPNSAEQPGELVVPVATAGGSAREFDKKPRGILSLPLKQIFTNVPFYALVVNHFCFDYQAVTLKSWVPSWLDHELGYE